MPRLSRRNATILALAVVGALAVAGYKMVYLRPRTEQLAALDFGGLPGIVVLGGEGCSACAAQKAVIAELAPSYGGRAKFLLLDVYDYPGLARTYKVQFIPTLLFVDRAGTVAAVRTGLTSAAELRAWLDEAVVPGPAGATGGLAGLVAAGGPLAHLAALLGGIVSSVNPCVLASLFVLASLMGSLGGRRPGGRAAMALAFAAGTVAVFAGLGVLAARAGASLGTLDRRWNFGPAALMAWMGLGALGVLPTPAWAGPGVPQGRRRAWLAAALGAGATFVLSPCATPVLVAVLGVAAKLTPAGAAGLLLAYGVGRAAPLVAAGLSWELLERALKRPGVSRAAGTAQALLGAGIMALAGYFLYLGL